MIPFRPDIPPHAPQVIRGLHPDLKQLIKAAIRAISTNPECGGPLQRELDGLRTYRVRRVRIVSIEQKKRFIPLVAVGQRRYVSEKLTGRLRRKTHA